LQLRRGIAGFCLAQRRHASMQARLLNGTAPTSILKIEGWPESNINKPKGKDALQISWRRIHGVLDAMGQGEIGCGNGRRTPSMGQENESRGIASSPVGGSGLRGYRRQITTCLWRRSRKAGGGNDPNDVRFSNRPSGVKHFQAIQHCSVDVAQGTRTPVFAVGGPHPGRTRVFRASCGARVACTLR